MAREGKLVVKRARRMKGQRKRRYWLMRGEEVAEKKRETDMNRRERKRWGGKQGGLKRLGGYGFWGALYLNL